VLALFASELANFLQQLLLSVSASDWRACARGVQVAAHIPSPAHLRLHDMQAPSPLGTPLTIAGGGRHHQRDYSGGRDAGSSGAVAGAQPAPHNHHPVRRQQQLVPCAALVGVMCCSRCAPSGASGAWRARWEVASAG